MEGFSIKILEASRNELISKSKSSPKGRERFDKRNKSSVSNTVKAMNSIDMNKLFKEDILTVNLPIKGETNNYTIKVSFGGFLEILRDQVNRSGQCTFREISRAAITGFNRDDVYIQCSCPDNQYRFNYWSTKNNYNSGAPETRPSKITNPRDSLGSTCKHTLLILNNTSWILRVARVITNYINYMQRHYEKMYADIIYPAIYGKEYEEPVQLSLDDSDELQTDTDIIDKSNQDAVDRTRFKPGNTQGMRFTSTRSDEDQVTLSDENPDDVL